VLLGPVAARPFRILYLCHPCGAGTPQGHEDAVEHDQDTTTRKVCARRGTRHLLRGTSQSNLCPRGGASRANTHHSRGVEDARCWRLPGASREWGQLPYHRQPDRDSGGPCPRMLASLLTGGARRSSAGLSKPRAAGPVAVVDRRHSATRKETLRKSNPGANARCLLKALLRHEDPPLNGEPERPCNHRVDPSETVTVASGMLYGIPHLVSGGGRSVPGNRRTPGGRSVPRPPKSHTDPRKTEYSHPRY
jgi:hypothetical protein